VKKRAIFQSRVAQGGRSAKYSIALAQKEMITHRGFFGFLTKSGSTK